MGVWRRDAHAKCPVYSFKFFPTVPTRTQRYGTHNQSDIAPHTRLTYLQCTTKHYSSHYPSNSKSGSLS